MMDFKYKQHLEIGKGVEEIFSRSFAVHLGIPADAIQKATEQEDRYDHYDLHYAGMKIDVKGLRKLYRDDPEPSPEFHWIEFRNVQGRQGWLYGQADIFAFELELSFLCVRREILQEFIHSRCADKKQMRLREPYTLYRRKDRKDILTIARSLDLAQISDFIIRKI